MSKKVFFFPGQGSQYAGMYNDCPENSKHIYEKAGEIIGFDLKQFCSEKENLQINDTKYSQIAIFTASMASYEYAKNNGITPCAVAGHSLGEYAAITAAGIITFDDACKLVKARGEIMSKHAKDGAMCAVIGTDTDTVNEVCDSISGLVTPVNYNSPVQIVIAGEKNAVQKAADEFKSRKNKAIMLPVSGAFHTSMMQKAADEFYEILKDIKFSKPNIDFYSNVTGKKMTDFSDMAGYFAKHMVSPVRFSDEITAIYADGYNDFYEIGPSKVLSGLINKTMKSISTAKYTMQNL